MGVETIGWHYTTYKGFPKYQMGILNFLYPTDNKPIEEIIGSMDILAFDNFMEKHQFFSVAIVGAMPVLKEMSILCELRCSKK